MLNTREKLMELLKGSDEYCDETCCEKCPYDSVGDCGPLMRADHLIANGVTVQKWIPVSERLPEKEGTYLTYTDKEQIHLDCFCIYPNHGTKFWVGGNGTVTHWMPLPEPPKGE